MIRPSENLEKDIARKGKTYFISTCYIESLKGKIVFKIAILNFVLFIKIKQIKQFSFKGCLII